MAYPPYQRNLIFNKLIAMELILKWETDTENFYKEKKEHHLWAFQTCINADLVINDHLFFSLEPKPKIWAPSVYQARPIYHTPVPPRVVTSICVLLHISSGTILICSPSSYSWCFEPTSSHTNLHTFSSLLAQWSFKNGKVKCLNMALKFWMVCFSDWSSSILCYLWCQIPYI